MDINITPRDRDILYSLLNKYLPDTDIWAHGSRVSGNAKPWSDLDLIVFTGSDQKIGLSMLKEALEESNLSFRVDLLEWDYLPDNFKANINASHAVLNIHS